MNGIQTFVVGRSNSRPTADLLVPASEDTVGRRHAEITLGADGSIYLVDLNSSNGTFVSIEKKWKKVNQSAVAMQQPVRLGDYETTIEKLLQLRRAEVPPVIPEARVSVPPVVGPSVKVQPPKNGRPPRRNPSTGEIE